MSRGRKPGYKHSEETKKRISQALKGQPITEETKRKMSDAKKGRTYSSEHRDSISQAKVLYNLDEKCVERFEDLIAGYPGQEEFFLDNEAELLIAMRDVRTEKELGDIRRYRETAALRPDEPYQYESTSCYAAEDAMIALLDFKRKISQYH
jgi:hypothetical protein